MTWLRYDGAELTSTSVAPGLHILTAADLDDMSNPRQRYWLPEFERAAAPTPARGAAGAAGPSSSPMSTAPTTTRGRSTSATAAPRVSSAPSRPRSSP